MKKTYITPATDVIEMEMQALMAASIVANYEEEANDAIEAEEHQVESKGHSFSFDAFED